MRVTDNVHLHKSKLSRISLFLVLAFVAVCIIGVKPLFSAGDGNLLKRSPEETCHACHKTNVNTLSVIGGNPNPDWDNAIKMHSAETLGSCSNSIYKTWSECIDPAKGNGTWTPGRHTASGGWGVAGGVYGVFLCTTCHTAHDTKNIFLVKETINATDLSFGNLPGAAGGTTVDFRAKAAGPTAGTMGDDSSSHLASQRVCEYCHTYDGTQAQGVNKHAFNMPVTIGHNGVTPCTLCHSHKDGFKVSASSSNACVSCHKSIRGSRRQIVDSNGDGTGAGGDFIKTSHHVYPASGTVNNSDCLLCHDTSQHGGGTVRLKDADTGAIYAYDPANPATAENFCLSCHDTDGANGNLSPFSDGKTLGAIPYKMGKDIKTNWTKTYGHKQQGLTCLGNGDPSTGCHSNGHGSNYVGLLARNLTLPNPETDWYNASRDEGSYDICFQCHQNYPQVTKEAILGYRLGGHYDTWGDGPPPYNILNIVTKFRDRYDGSAKLYDDGGMWTGYSNLHYFHVQAAGWTYRGSMSSSVSCIACHSVHGSNTQWGSVYDTMEYNHYTGEGSDQYGTMDVTNYSILATYPMNCTFNCHTIQGKTYNWFEPANE